MLTRAQAAERIRERFPGVKVLWCESMFIDGIGVETPDGQRNAVQVRGDDQWGQASEMLCEWLQRIGKPADASTDRRD